MGKMSSVDGAIRMAINPQPKSEPTLQDVIQRLDAITEDLEKRDKWQDRMSEQTERWQDRTWDVIKWVGGISAGLSISAAIAILGLAIRAAAK